MKRDKTEATVRFSRDELIAMAAGARFLKEHLERVAPQQFPTAEVAETLRALDLVRVKAGAVVDAMATAA